VRVDEISVLLLAIIALVPLAGYLRRLKWGDKEIEFFRRISATQSEIQRDQRKVEDIVADQFAHGAELLEELGSSPRGAAPTGGGIRAVAGSYRFRPIRRILWVDDHPEWNRIEADALRRSGMEIVFEKDNDRALELLSSTEGYDAVITDLVRDAEDVRHPASGIELITKIRSRDASLPIFVYSSEGALLEQRDALQGVAISAATASMADLFGAIHELSTNQSEAGVLGVLSEFERLTIVIQTETGDFPDFLVSSGSRCLGVEVRRRLVGRSIRSVPTLLQQEIDEGRLDKAIVVLALEPSAAMLKRVLEVGAHGVAVVASEEALRNEVQRWLDEGHGEAP
jgi:CheY-like chemotaxis protein